jgi:hypothetical protein
MSFYIRHRGIPIKFLEMAGKDVANQVTVNMATPFETRDLALGKAHQQFGDAGLEHIDVCTVGAPYTPRRDDEQSQPKLKWSQEKNVLRCQKSDQPKLL